MTQGAEREVKLAAWPGFVLPDLGGVATWVATADRERRRLDATYFDSADLRLVRAGVTLRHRLGEGSDEGRWTLKLPVDGKAGAALERTEVEVDGPPGEVPAALANAVAGLLRRAELQPVARLQTDRRVMVLRDGGGRPLAEVCDDEVTVVDGDRVAVRFRELEAEAKAGAPEGLVELVADRLRRAGAGEPDATPKLVRALGPAALAPPDPVPVPLGDRPTIAAVVQHAIAAAVGRLLAHDPIVRLDLGPHGVHQARVSTRRLRSDLRTFADVLDEAWAEGLREELKWLADALGAVRDVDVLRQRLERHLAELPPADAAQGEGIVRHLTAQRRERLDRLHRTLESDRYFDLLDRLMDAAAEPRVLPTGDRPAGEVLPRLVAKPWRKLAKQARATGKDATDEELHALRIRAKRTRYAAEAAARVLSKAADFAAKVADLQDVLGEHHDAVVAEQWLRGAVAHGLSRQQAMVAGLLIARQQRDADEHRRAWRKVWRALDTGKARAWLGPHA